MNYEVLGTAVVVLLRSGSDRLRDAVGTSLAGDPDGVLLARAFELGAPDAERDRSLALRVRARAEGDPVLAATLFDVAMAVAEDQLTERRARGSDAELIEGLANVGMLAAARGEMVGAIEAFGESVEVATRILNRPAMAMALGDLGLVHAEAGEFETAERCLEHALQGFAELRDESQEARTRFNLGRVRSGQGRWPEADADLHAAVKGFRRLREPEGESLALLALGSVQAAEHSWASATASMTAAVRMFRARGDRHGEAVASAALAGLYEREDRWTEATELLELAASTHAALGERRLQGDALARLSIIAQAQTLWSQASAWGEQAVAAFELAGDRAATARARANVGRALLNEGRLDEAVRSLQVAEEELWALSDPMGRAVALESLGLAQILLARRSEGVGLLGRALSLVEAANDRAAASRIRQQLTDLGGPQD